MKFRASVNGFITGIRFYKGTQNTGTHTGSLWSSSGTSLATATFTNETASGWQQVLFGTPVAVTAGTTYVASYHAPNGRYSTTTNYFANTYTRAPLTAPSSGSSGGNGVFRTSTSRVFPNSTSGSTNYWVDVVFQLTVPAGTPPGAPTGVTATAGSASAQVSWTAPAANGSAITSYTVTPFIGATAQSPTTVSGSPPATSTTITGLTNGTTYTFRVSATNGAGTGPASAASNAVTPVAPTCPCSLWTSTTPATVTDNDRSNIELGVKFTANVNGSITGIRFYKGPSNTGTHTGSLWSASGALLATATFTNETTTGWQQVLFSSPIPIVAGTTYVASYHAPFGQYSVTENFFATTFSRGPLTAPSTSASGGNGVYKTGASTVFPTQTFKASNYFVDVVFTTP